MPDNSAQTAVSFAQMALSDAMRSALQEADYTEPTPVQAGMIPIALKGIDVMAQAKTGTGKTAAFLIPILEQLETRSSGKGPQALILAPTRELAVQVRDEAAKLAYGQHARIIAVYGGKPIRPQIERLRRGIDIVVGTPGRVMDHMQRGTLRLGDIRFAVLDEADRMLDIGFRPDIEKILRRCPQSRQTMLLSATVPPPVQRLALRYMRDPQTLNFSPKDITVDTIDQYYFTVEKGRKFDVLLRLLKQENPKQAIIFCRTKRQTQRLHDQLKRKMRDVDCIHGDLPQRGRDRAMERFRSGKARLLVATDVVGRGIDVTGISHIINFEIPQFCDDYIHRVGRTGRMGRQGVAYTFVTPEEGSELTRIEIRINKLLKRAEIPGGGVQQDVERPKEGAETTKPPENGKDDDKPPSSRPVTRGRGPKRYRRAL